jgi:signal peptidase II
MPAPIIRGTINVKRKLTILGATLPIILIADIFTKRWAVEALYEASRPDFMGGAVPLTLAYNRGAAFGISIGDDPRWFFIPVALLALGLMVALIIRAHDRDHLRLISLALVISGALGNLIDRVRWDQGVVDFIGPVPLGFMNWPIFNVADMAISCGAVLLAVSFWIEDRALRRAEGDKRADAPAEVMTGPEPTES